MSTIFKEPINILLALVLIASMFAPPMQIMARTVDEIQKEIEAKQKELTDVKSDVETIELEIENQKQAIVDATGKRSSLNAKIALNQNEKLVIQKKLDDLNKQQEIKSLEREKRIQMQDSLISSSYISWKQYNFLHEVFANEDQSVLKLAVYHESVSGDEQKNIEGIESELDQINSDLEKSEEQKVLYQNEINRLTTEAKSVEEELAQLDTKVKANENDLQNYRARLGGIQSQIDELTAEQKAIQEYEDSLLVKPTNGGTKTLQSGQIYFQGVGRDSYQGHGVGMSQFGALGASLNGWDYKKIVEYYYPGAKVVTYTDRDKIKVDGYGEMSIEDYVAGAGEVLDYACEDLDLEFDPNDIWKCWPKEAIKAQMVVYRTYGIYRTANGSSICTSTKCQVYKGGHNKQWAADETKNEVLVYDGEPIAAFYSSDNNNGWGTANNDTVWSNFEGVGTAKPYLRAVKDSDFTFNYTYTKWGWRTNGYTISDIDTMLEWSATSSKASGSYKVFLTEVRSSIGKLKSIDFVRDPSGRVVKVKLNGDKGSKYVAGWLFKSIWNIWIGNEKPSGELDYIYSLTYYMKVA